MLIIAQEGIVIIHESTISLNVLRLRADIPFANPTPKIPPTNAWVVEMGSPNFEASKIVTAAPNSAEKPLVGVRVVIL